VVQARLPAPFRPKLYNGEAIVGVCLIRLENIRPAACTAGVGFFSENAAHRIAVDWDEDGELREGVFIPRRDTGSVLNHLSGGRLFPGQHCLATFRIRQTETAIDFHLQSRDGEVEVRVAGEIGTELPPNSGFASLAEASAFFERGCLGFSVRRDSERLDGMLLKTHQWYVQILAVSEVYSSYYANPNFFPPGSVRFDHALIMRNIEHEWHAAEEPRRAVASAT